VNAWVRRFQASLAELSPEQAAMLLSVGLVLGVFPIMGCPTLLCLLAALVFRLNWAALQLLNNISSPLQLALLIPLARAGARLIGGGSSAGGSWATAIGFEAFHAITGWACICIPLGALFYISLVFLLRTKMGARSGIGTPVQS